MGLTVKTIVKIYLLFFVFQLCCNLFIETMPNAIDTMTDENQVYIDWLTTKVNGEIDSEATGNSLLTNFEDSLRVPDLFNTSIASAFWGVLVVIGSVIWFLVQLAFNILFTPGVITSILLYNFIASTSSLFLVSIIIDVFFYMTMFYIVFKRRTTQ